MGLGKAYLILYNVSMVLGWTYLAFLILSSGDIDNKKKKLYSKVEIVLKIAQTGAILEILHAIVGLVKSNPVLTGFQVFSRIFVLWAILHSVPESRGSYGLPLLLFAWTVTEIVRYSFYACNLLELSSFGLLVWCRYSFFIVLYPIGISGELLAMYVALPKIKASNMFSITVPNRWNFTFNFYYVLIFIMLMYIPVFLQLYGHMLKQRSKVIGGNVVEKKTA